MTGYYRDQESLLRQDLQVSFFPTFAPYFHTHCASPYNCPNLNWAPRNCRFCRRRYLVYGWQVWVDGFTQSLYSFWISMAELTIFDPNEDRLDSGERLSWMLPQGRHWFYYSPGPFRQSFDYKKLSDASTASTASFWGDCWKSWPTCLSAWVSYANDSPNSR